MNAATNQAAHANEQRFNLGTPDLCLVSELADAEQEAEAAPVHCSGCTCSRKAPKVREVVKTVRGRVVRETWCGPFRI